MTTLVFQKIHSLAKTPHKTYLADACWDLFSCEDVSLAPGSNFPVSTGLIFDIPAGFCVEILSRSGLAAKYSVSVLNAPGIIDSGYAGEIKVVLHNHSKLDWMKLEMGSKIAQCKLTRLENYDVVEGEVNLNTPRAANGLGSTGV